MFKRLLLLTGLLTVLVPTAFAVIGAAPAVNRNPTTAVQSTVTLTNDAKFQIKGPSYNLHKIGFQILNSSGGSVGWCKDDGNCSFSGSITANGVVLGAGGGAGAAGPVSGTGSATQFSYWTGKSTLSGATMTFWKNTQRILSINGTFSGSSLYAANTLASSGSLKVLGNMSGASLNVNNLLNCTNLQTNLVGRLACNTASYQTTSLTEDNVWIGNGSAQASLLPSCSGANNALLYNNSTNTFSCGTPAGTTYTAGQGLTLSSTSFKLGSTLSGSTLNGWTTISGATLYGGTMSGRSLIVTGTGTNATSTAPLLFIKLGSNRIGIGTNAPRTMLEIMGSFSGTSLTVNGTTTIMGHSYTWPTIQGTNGQILTNNGSDTLSWTTVSGGGTTYTAGQGLTLAGTSFKTNATLTGSTLRGWRTMSGTVVYGQTMSGQSLKVTGTGATPLITSLLGANRIGILKTNPATAFDVVGTISGSGLQINGSATIRSASITSLSPTTITATLINSNTKINADQASQFILFGGGGAAPRLSQRVSNGAEIGWEIAGAGGGNTDVGLTRVSPNVLRITNGSSGTTGLGQLMVGNGTTIVTKGAALTAFGSGSFTGNMSGASLTVTTGASYANKGLCYLSGTSGGIGHCTTSDASSCGCTAN